MLFHLFFELKDIWTPLNVFRYPSFRVMVAFLTSVSITYFLYPGFIRRLQERQIGQVIREELDESHQLKKDTPTMGGVLIIVAVLVTALLWCDLTNVLVWGVAGITACFTAIGFIDDTMKLGERGSKGLSEKGKLLGQFLVALVGLGLLFYVVDHPYSTRLYFPFVSVDRFSLELPSWLYIVFASFVIVGASNAVNFTDGLDGLAIGPVVVASGTFGVLAYLAATALTLPVMVDGVQTVAELDFAQYLKIPHVEGAHELSVFASAMVGAGVGFLWYNTFPAQVFMGDVGSLGLGGALGTFAVLTKNELLSAIILGIPVVEAISVIIQRYYYKATGGKRIFLMAPIHHHFEKLDWAENQIVVRFWIISIMLSLLALASLKLR